MPSSYCRMVGEFAVRLAPLGRSLHQQRGAIAL